MNRLQKNQQIILTSKIFFTSLVFRFQYFNDKKTVEIKIKKLVNLASIKVDKYLFFDNPVFRNSETGRPISDFQLKKSNINNMCS